MKKQAIIIAALVLVAAACGLGGCTTMERNARYVNLAKEHPFDYFFPSGSLTRTFATLDEAYEYVKTLQAKFSKSVAKPFAKGLSAKLTGPVVNGKQPVTVSWYLTPGTGSGANENRSLEETVRAANSARITFLIFYEDRGVSIPRYYLRSGYVYLAGNTQVRGFVFNNAEYAAEYPVNWNTETAFRYLGKEIN